MHKGPRVCHGGRRTRFPPAEHWTTLPGNQHFQSFVLVFCSEGTSTVTHDTTLGPHRFPWTAGGAFAPVNSTASMDLAQIPNGVKVWWKPPEARARTHCREAGLSGLPTGGGGGRSPYDLSYRTLIT